MSALAEIQRGFARAVLNGDASGIGALIVNGGVTPDSRLRIYRTNVRENFYNALTAGFPVLFRLVGEAYFRQMAWAYQQRHPSPSGNLFHTGERLAEFLDNELSDTEHDYLADVARLEWLCQECGIEVDHLPLSLERLARVPTTAYPRLKFALHPSVRLMESRFPVMRIWKVNQPGADPDEQVDLAAGPDRLLVRCTGSEIELRQLAPGEFAFLSALQGHEALAEAYDAATVIAPDFALDAQLKTWISLNVISDFHIL